MLPSLILPFADTMPSFAGEPIHAGPRSAVLGRATIGANAWLGEDSVVRADGEVVRIGDGVHLGYRATVHIVHETTPAIIGSNVTIGANCVVHACTIGDGCVIEDDVTVLDDAVVAENVLIERGSTVFPRKTLEAGWIYAGSPAKPVRALEPGECAARAAALRGARGSERSLSHAVQDFGDDVFVAATAQRAGRLSFAPGSSLFFSCVADAGTGTIFVGENTNVQDNTLLRAGQGEIVIGRGTTIGHNVRMGAGRVGDAALVGIGAVLAEGTIVQDDVLLAAGATTEPGQVLESGWLWGGRPAKPMSRLDADRRAMMAANIETYRTYSQLFRAIQQGAAPRS
jgi:carbonic anhydrase/acetyltransferase-like protein (isoleucine patch superfamily)